MVFEKLLRYYVRPWRERAVASSACRFCNNAENSGDDGGDRDGCQTAKARMDASHEGTRDGEDYRKKETESLVKR